MAQIHVLEQHVADLIASGEVVSRPASVVKELVENSIDAGATSITVEISSGGMALIRVTDNGCGIASDYIKTAFLRHATSKLFDASGLESIETLGFRGEALAAIAAVSRVEIQSCLHDKYEGASLSLCAGEVLDFSPAGCPAGTTITIRDLFFNTPARLKFMKTDRAEGSAVSSVVLRCALSRPDISFKYIKDGKTEYNTPGDSKVDSCVYSLLGRDTQSGFDSVEYRGEGICVSGFASKPGFARGNRNYQFFFVNGRSIRSFLLQSALEQAYKNTIPTGLFPACVLYIKTPPASVDVNVHPSKAEVKFVSDKQLFDGVYYAARGVLEHQSPLETHGELRGLHVSEPVRNYASPVVSYEPFNDVTTRPPALTVDPAFSYLLETAQAPCVVGYNTAPAYRYIGEAFSVYIIIEYEHEIWFIDKHAVHERVHFDLLKSGTYEPMSESLLTPVICKVGHENAMLLYENSDFLDSLGFTAESFGNDAVAVRHIPADIDIDDAESVFSEICVHLKQGMTLEPANLDNLYKAIACKAAIKAGSSSDTRELEALVSKVVSEEVTHCPHGRPVVYKITKLSLEKSFGRI